MRNEEKIVKITRISRTEYYFGDSSNWGARRIVRALTFPNPNPFAYSDSIKKYNEKRLTFPVGIIKTVRERLDEQKVKYTIDDYKYSLPKSVKIDSRLSGKYLYQRHAVEAFYKRRIGIIKVPTRGGKTFIASEIFRIFLATEKNDKQILFVVDNTTLFEQAMGDIQRFFEPYGGITVGEIKSGKCDTRHRVTVAMIQTIDSILHRSRDKVKKRELKKYLKNLAFLCVDEIHDNASASRMRIYKMCKVLEYQLCLSATPYKSEQLEQNLRIAAWSGDVIYEITEEMLIDIGALTEYRVIGLMRDYNEEDVDVGFGDYDSVMRAIVTQNPERDRMLCDLIERLSFELGLKVLVLFTSIPHGSKIKDMTGYTFIHGGTKTLLREEAKSVFLTSDGGSVLMASSVFKKGVTLPEAEVVINVDGGLEDANTIQKKGRILGVTETKKKSVVIDFFDIYDYYLTDHTSARLQAYTQNIANPDTNVIIIDTSDKDWLCDVVEFIAEYMR